MSRVFVVQQPAFYDRDRREFVPKYDLSAAARFGKLVFILQPGNIFKEKLGQAVRQIQHVLDDFTTADYILAVGDPVAIAAAVLVAGDVTEGKIRLLKWDRISAAYEPFLIET